MDEWSMYSLGLTNTDDDATHKLEILKKMKALDESRYYREALNAKERSLRFQEDLDMGYYLEKYKNVKFRNDAQLRRVRGQWETLLANWKSHCLFIKHYERLRSEIRMLDDDAQSKIGDIVREVLRILPDTRLAQAKREDETRREDIEQKKKGMRERIKVENPKCETSLNDEGLLLLKENKKWRRELEGRACDDCRHRSRSRDLSRTNKRCDDYSYYSDSYYSSSDSSASDSESHDDPPKKKHNEKKSSEKGHYSDKNVWGPVSYTESQRKDHERWQMVKQGLLIPSNQKKLREKWMNMMDLYQNPREGRDISLAIQTVKAELLLLWMIHGNSHWFRETEHYLACVTKRTKIRE